MSQNAEHGLPPVCLPCTSNCICVNGTEICLPPPTANYLITVVAAAAVALIFGSVGVAIGRAWGIRIGIVRRRQTTLRAEGFALASYDDTEQFVLHERS